MGGCLSSSSSSPSPGGAVVKVIWMDGELREYTPPVTAEQVVASAKDECFICNSDTLYFDQPIPPLRSEDDLRAGDIYFVLHHSERQRPLSAADMAALALKATAALHLHTKEKKKKKKHSRIMPSEDDFTHPPHYDYHLTVNNGKSAASSSSAAKLRRLTSSSSRRAKMAVRSFKLRLSTIYE